MIWYLQTAWSESTFAKAQADVDGDIQTPSAELNAEIEAAAARVNKPLTKARIHSSDVFYQRTTWTDTGNFLKSMAVYVLKWKALLYLHNAKILNKRAACLLTISDSLVTHAETTAQERQTSFHDMMLVALETAVAL